MKWLVRGLMFAWAFALAIPAAAHPVPFSYLDLQLQPDAIEVSLVAHIYDLAHDLGISPIERLLEPGFVAERAAAIRSLVVPRLQISIDGRPMKIEWSDPEILQDRQSLKLRFRYPISSAPGTIAVNTVMFPYDPNHQTFVNVYERDEITSQFILDHNHTQTEYFSGNRQGVFAFGFIYGFGFANVLREMGLPSRALTWSLFSFNLGVEIGQLIVVVAVASALAALRSRSSWAGRHIAFAGSIVVIAAGAFWFIQRVFFPGGIS